MNAIKHKIKNLLGIANNNPQLVDEATFKAWLEDGHAVRYVMYKAIYDFVKREFFDKQKFDLQAIEFGGSNTLIKGIFNSANYEIAENYPEVDITDLKGYADNSYDVVITDQVMEHVADPWAAVAEVRRILKPGGWFICTTPFLIQIHNYPGDFWRFTPDGIKVLMRDYAKTIVDSWGNCESAAYYLSLKDNWPTVSQAKNDNKFILENEKGLFIKKFKPF